MVGSKNKRNWFFLIVLLILCAFMGYQYIYQDHRDIETEKAEYTTTPQSISDEFKQDALKSEKKFLNKTIEILGIVTEVNQNNITLNDLVFCQFNDMLNQSIKINTTLKVKGRCIGYDDLLEQVKLDQCTIIN
ncbi:MULTISPECIES: OB-fold protein [Hwangdonia]|uniref:tRNA_anti-like n=1 Tax=Hwangdonia seohaensis TaxID=1240727 RepID=A0ABW3RER9_9FLAO